MPTRLYFTFALTILLAVALFYYHKLGGFEDVVYKTTELPAQYLVGFEYTGQSTDKAFKELMDKAFEANKTGALQGHFAVCYLGNPDAEDSIRMMVGVLRADLLQLLPAGTAQWTLPAGKAVEASINSYSVTAPTPDEVNASLYEYAQSQGIALGNMHLEYYASNNALKVYVLAKP
jgi:hypothetical protein